MRMLSQAELRQISGVEICVFSACRHPPVAMDWREMSGVASTRLRQRNIGSHNRDYVNKPLIYIIKMENQVYTSPAEFGQEVIRSVISQAAQTLFTASTRRLLDWCPAPRITSARVY